MPTNDEYAVYLKLCEASNVQPLEQGGQLAMIQAMWALGPHVIPYLTATDSIWVHDTRHKTHKQDRPFAVANMQALQEK